MNDTLTVRVVVGGLILIVLLIVLGGIWLAAHGQSLPDALIAIAGLALGRIPSTRPADAPAVQVPTEAAEIAA